MYDNWIEYVKRIVPSERLLIFNVKDGITSLASFCECPVPDWTMPNRNDKGRFGFLVLYLKETGSSVYTDVY